MTPIVSAARDRNPVTLSRNPERWSASHLDAASSQSRSPANSADVHDELADAHEHGDHPDVADDHDGEQRDDRGR